MTSRANEGPAGCLERRVATSVVLQPETRNADKRRRDVQQSAFSHTLDPVETLVTGSYLARRRALPMRFVSSYKSPGVPAGSSRLRALALCDELILRLQLQQCRSHLLLQISQFGNLPLQTT